MRPNSGLSTYLQNAASQAIVASVLEESTRNEPAFWTIQVGWRIMDWINPVHISGAMGLAGMQSPWTFHKRPIEAT